MNKYLCLAVIIICLNIHSIQAQSDVKQVNKEKIPKEYLLRSNSLYAELYGFIGILYYGKAIENNSDILFTLNGGLTYFDGLIMLGETTLLLGKERHYIEPGLGFVVFQNEKTDLGYTMRMGYRYQGRGGLLIKIGIINIDSDILPIIGLGYSF